MNDFEWCVHVLLFQFARCMGHCSQAVVATAGVAQNSWRKGLWKDSQQASAHCKFQCCNGLLKGGIMGVLHLHVRAYEPHCKFLQVLHQCRDDSWPLQRSDSIDLHNPTSSFTEQTSQLL